MTEAEWLARGDPTPMLMHLEASASARKLRLLAVACCRRVTHPMLRERSREAIEAATRYADQAATNVELDDARLAARREWERLGTVEEVWRGPGQENPIEWLTHESAVEAAYQASGWAASLVAGDESGWDSRIAAEKRSQILIVRDIFGNPFRPATFDPAWRTSTAVALAQAMYESRDFTPMPILGDALQDAGCDNEDILNHCRGPGPHVRGCWVVDLVLGKE